MILKECQQLIVQFLKGAPEKIDVEYSTMVISFWKSSEKESNRAKISVLNGKPQDQEFEAVLFL